MESYYKDTDTTFITVTNIGANGINGIVVDGFFKGERAIAHVCLANEQENRPLYKNVRLVITENRNKSRLVNGQIC